MEHSWINADLRLSEIPDKGIKVEHNGRSYIAREQTLNSRTIAIFEICVELGFSVAIQKGHPRDDRLLPKGIGVVYLSLARDYDEQWVIVIDDQKDEGRNRILINKRYQALLQREGIHFEIQARNPSHLIIDFLDIITALTLINRDDPF
jgi:hypothetical protein